MPRRGSKAQLIHLLADDYAFTCRAVLGDHHAHAGDFYEQYQYFSQDELKEMAAHITARRRGRPKKAYTRYKALLPKVDELRARREDLSERAACNHVAAKHGVSANMLRKVHRLRPKPCPN